MHADTETLTRWTSCTITGGAGTRWNLLEPSGDTLVAVVKLAGSVPRLYWSDGIMQDAENLGDALRLVRLVHPAADLMPGVDYSPLA